MNKFADVSKEEFWKLYLLPENILYKKLDSQEYEIKKIEETERGRNVITKI